MLDLVQEVFSNFNHYINEGVSLELEGEKVSLQQFLIISIIDGVFEEEKETRIPIKELIQLTEGMFLNPATIDSDIKSLLYDKLSLKNRTSSVIIQEIANLSTLINLYTGQSLSMYEVIASMKRNPDLRKVVEEKVNANLSVNEIDAAVNQRVDYFIKAIIADKENPYSRVLSGPKTSIRHAAIGQFYVAGGLRPDVSGSVDSSQLITSSMADGFQSVNDYLLNAKSARKAQVMTFVKTPTAGYTSRKVSLSSIDLEFRNDEEKCDTKHPLKVFVKDESVLSRLKGRFAFNLEEDVRIDHTDKELIGKTIEIFSPITCSSKSLVDELKIAESSTLQILNTESFFSKFGKVLNPENGSVFISLPKSNYGEFLKTRVLKAFDFAGAIVYSTFGVVQLLPKKDSDIQVINQEEYERISKKFKVTMCDSESASSFKETLNEIFKENCEIKLHYSIYKRKRYYKDTICKRCVGSISKRISQFKIGTLSEKILTNFLIQIILSAKHLLKALIKQNIEVDPALQLYFDFSEEEISVKKKLVIQIVDSEIDHSGDLVVSSFKIFEKEPSDSDIVDEPETHELNGFKISFPKDFQKKYLDENGCALGVNRFVHLKEDEQGISVKVQNIELSSTMEELIRLLELKDGNEYTYESLYNKMIQLVGEAKLKIQSNMVEVILSALVRSSKNIQERPDFSDPNLETEDTRVVSTIEFNSQTSPAILWSFERQKDFLYNPEKFWKPFSKSNAFDYLFT